LQTARISETDPAPQYSITIFEQKVGEKSQKEDGDGLIQTKILIELRMKFKGRWK